jgi:hypothetical protein
MISRATKVWFLLLVISSGFMGAAMYEDGRPCREWKTSHPGKNPNTFDPNDPDLSFNPCTLIS